MKTLNNQAANVIRQNIKRFGKDIEFKRPAPNKYGEVTDTFEITVIQRCLYHVSTEYGRENAIQTDAGKTHGYKIDMLLTEYNSNIKIEDYCNIGDKFYRIYDIQDYDQDNTFVEILLQEVRRELN